MDSAADYFVYILRSERDDGFYIGHTRNLDDRFRRHNTGRSSYTKARAPWRLVYFERYSSRSEAMMRERQLKARHSHEFLEGLIADQS